MFGSKSIETTVDVMVKREAEIVGFVFIDESNLEISVIVNISQRDRTFFTVERHNGVNSVKAVVNVIAVNDILVGHVNILDHVMGD